MALTCSRTWLYPNSGDLSNWHCSTSTSTLKTLIQISAINEVSISSLKWYFSILLLALLLSFNTGQITVVLVFPQWQSEILIIFTSGGECVWFFGGVFFVLFLKHSPSTGNTRFIPSGQHSSEKLAFKVMRRMRQIPEREQAQLCIYALGIILFQNKEYCYWTMLYTH